MAVSTAKFLKKSYDAIVATGDKIISSDSTFVIEGMENSRFFIDSFPMPVLSTGEAIEVPMMFGATKWQKKQVTINKQGAFSMQENTQGHATSLLMNIINGGGEIRAKVYEGTPEGFLRAYQLEGCSINMEDPERSWENGTEIVKLTGTIFYHFFGEIICGTGYNFGQDKLPSCAQSIQ